MENLSELLREGHGGDAHTLRDDRLTEEVGSICGPPAVAMRCVVLQMLF